MICAKCGIELRPGERAIVLHGGKVRHEECRTSLPPLNTRRRNDTDERSAKALIGQRR